MAGELFIAAKTLAQRFGYYGTVNTGRPPTLAGGKRSAAQAHLSGVTMAILRPSGMPSIQLMQDIGGERSVKVGAAAPGTDIKAGDEIYQGAVVYVVDGVEQSPDMTYCALSKVEG